MGTTIAAYIASQRLVTGLILGMPTASAEEEGPVYLSQAHIPGWIASSMVPSEEASRIFGEAAELKPYTGPLLILEGTNDTLVPMIEGRHILEAVASEHKSLIVVQDADHNAVIDSSTAMQAVSKFLHEL